MFGGMTIFGPNVISTPLRSKRSFISGKRRGPHTNETCCIAATVLRSALAVLPLGNSKKASVLSPPHVEKVVRNVVERRIAAARGALRGVAAGDQAADERHAEDADVEVEGGAQVVGVERQVVDAAQQRLAHRRLLPLRNRFLGNGIHAFLGVNSLSIMHWSLRHASLPVRR